MLVCTVVKVKDIPIFCQGFITIAPFEELGFLFHHFIFDFPYERFVKRFFDIYIEMLEKKSTLHI